MNKFVTYRSLTAAFAGILLIAATAASAPRAAAEVTTTTLANGMKVIVWPDHDIPNVALYNWFRAGGRNERPGITGLSHFFEHMMFNGSAKYASGEFDRVMEANGGANNAYTSEDVTVYQDWFPRSALELIFQLEADRICCLAIEPKVVESERGVVFSERRTSVDNDTVSFLNEQLLSTAFLAHPYQIPVIGWPSDIESWTIADLTQYFRTYYAPNNATLLVVGDVTADEVFALARKYLEPIPAQPPPPPVHTKEPLQEGERRLVVRRPAQAALLQMAFHIGSASDPDAEALDLLETVLAGGESSRLYRRLVDTDQVALDVQMFTVGSFDPGVEVLAVTASRPDALAGAEKAVLEELERVGREGITEAELQKAKNVQLSRYWRSRKTISGKAQALGTYEVFRKDYRLLFDAPERYGRVTREQVQKLAARVFTERNRTVALLVPENPADEVKK